MQEKKNFIRLPEVIRRTGLSKSTVYAWSIEGRFPKPRKVGRLNLWLETDIDQWIDDSIA